MIYLIEIAILSSTNFSTNQVTSCSSDYRTVLLLAKWCYEGKMNYYAYVHICNQNKQKLISSNS